MAATELVPIPFQMSWLNTASIANLAKSALKEAQKTIDRALDIKENADNDVVSSSLRNGMMHYEPIT